MRPPRLLPAPPAVVHLSLSLCPVRGTRPLQVVAEIQKKMYAEGRGPADEKGQSPGPSILQQIFTGNPNKNPGYVPPYDPRSRRARALATQLAGGGGRSERVAGHGHMRAVLCCCRPDSTARQSYT